MNLNFGKLSDSAQHMIDSIMARLPSLVVAIAVFVLFYILSIFVGRIIRSATRAHRQNLLEGLLLLWAEPFRVGDEIKLDPYEGTVEEIQARATIIKTYDQRRVVIPNADLFTHSVIVNTAFDIRRWEHDLTV